MAGFIAGTHQLPAAATMNLALPPGSVLNGWMLAVEAEGSSTPVTGAIAGSTQLLSAAANNMYIQVLAKQLNSTDISNQFLAVTGTTTGRDWWAVAYDTTISGFDTVSSFPLGASFYGTRGGVSQTFTTAPSSIPNGSGDYVIVLSFERTIAATTVSSISQGTQDYYNEATTTNVSALAAHFTGPAAGVATGVSTITYSNASGNGLALLLPMVSPGGAVTTTDAIAAGGTVSVQTGATPTTTDTITTGGLVGTVAGTAVAAIDTVASAGIVGVQTTTALTSVDTVTVAGLVGAQTTVAFISTDTIAATGRIGLIGSATLNIHDGVTATGPTPSSRDIKLVGIAVEPDRFKGLDVEPDRIIT